MSVSALPPLLSSDGHLEVRPERWTPRMPAALRDRAPRTITLADGGDAILVEGQPPYPVDRTGEHLGTSDSAIIKVRRRLLDAARALRDRGAPPPAQDPAAFLVRSASVVVPPEADWVPAATPRIVVRPGQALQRVATR
jgi:hypothetical protein